MILGEVIRNKEVAYENPFAYSPLFYICLIFNFDILELVMQKMCGN